jgi:hypothetical protein
LFSLINISLRLSAAEVAQLFYVQLTNLLRRNFYICDDAIDIHSSLSHGSIAIGSAAQEMPASQADQVISVSLTITDIVKEIPLRNSCHSNVTFTYVKKDVLHLDSTRLIHGGVLTVLRVELTK